MLDRFYTEGKRVSLFAVSRTIDGLFALFPCSRVLLVYPPFSDISFAFSFVFYFFLHMDGWADGF